ncbi:isoquinoline 1-oxidoreductase beta subunit [Mumia flava]|uniref:Isoquinoline 1-oxidoreductase beta subunit n=1 Tax=Mumia flava TaxID=1348852 RepID=A0A0B2BMF3_9ACTN|nr:molybdopterin cofactor-binding domain-containing protein [Mumia flava]PJJ54234.1 isoquinoline 1-oxidoreductase beta subunit [Mumia flava]
MTNHHGTEQPRPDGIGRRRFLGYVLAAPTLAAAAQIDAPGRAQAAVTPQPTDIVDLNDLMTVAALPTSHLVTVMVNTDGTVSFALPRAEVGQGITTSTAMLIAEELDVGLERVKVSLADARPELVFNQLTGGSNTTIATYEPIRVAAAVARKQLLLAAAAQLGVPTGDLTLADGTVTAPDGTALDIGSLAEKAASTHVHRVSVSLKPRSQFAVIGTARTRVDALAAVTGRKTFAMDLDVPDAKPTMVCRAPTLNGTPRSAANLAQVRSMPGVTDVVTISTGIAVRAETFGQCIDAIQVLEVAWRDGTAEGKSDDDVLRELRWAEPSLGLPPLAPTIDERFTFAFRSNSALETNCAVADVRSDRAEIWSSLKSPIVAQQTIAAKLRLPVRDVTVHVTEGGGSFGRKLFFDAALEAAEISRAIGKPVKLMWHRADEPRQGRTHPMATSRVRTWYLGGHVLGFKQAHTSVATDLGHGFGELVTATAAHLPIADQAFSQVFFQLSQTMPYEFGASSRILNETDRGFNTGSMRNVYSPDVTCSRELVVDRLAARMREDPYRFRRRMLRTDRARAVLDEAARVGEWGRSLPDGVAQGIAFHDEYRAVSAVLVEIDCRPQTVGRQIRDAVTGPRVTKAVVAVDVGLAVNPKGLEAQMMGCVMDGIAHALTAGLHLRDGAFLEASWDNDFYTRQWNTPPDFRVVVMPPTTGEPGGAGELGVAGAMAAVACAYARATGSMPTRFPINHGTLSFEPKPPVPPVPQSPTDGLDHVR